MSWAPPVGAPIGSGAGSAIAPADAFVVADRVSKWFGDVVAVSDVSFVVGPGVTALLGPNGAGKSTVMRMMCGLAQPSSGSLTVLGGVPRRELALMGRIGLVPQQEAMFETQTPLEFVVTAARMLGVPDAVAAARSAIDTVELDPDDARPVRGYSKGMRQRVRIAAGIVHDPDLLVLDEPLTGLDPRQRISMIELVHRLGARPGRAVIVSSHVLDEVERFGSNIIVIAQGRLAAQGDFRAIRALMDDRLHTLRVGSDRARRLAAELVADGLVQGVSVNDEVLIAQTPDVARFRRGIAGAARRIDASLTEVVPLDDDLEAVFRYLVER